MSVGRQPPSAGTAKGYALTLAGALLGLLGGTMIGLLLISTFKGDPDAGLANVALIAAAVGMVYLCAFLGAPLGCYVLLRALRQPLAGRTAAFVLGLQGTFLFVTSAFWELGPMSRLMTAVQVAVPLLARYGALRSVRRGPHDRVVVGAIFALPVLAGLLLLAIRQSPGDEQRELLKKVDFSVYAPADLPAGAKPTSWYVDTDYDGNVENVKLEYEFSSGGRFYLMEYRDRGRFRPPEDCGPTMAGYLEDLTHACRYEFTDPGGHQVYTYTGSNIRYLTVGNTIITFSALRGPHLEQILGSLREVDHEWLINTFPMK